MRGVAREAMRDIGDEPRRRRRGGPARRRRGGRRRNPAGSKGLRSPALLLVVNDGPASPSPRVSLASADPCCAATREFLSSLLDPRRGVEPDRDILKPTPTTDV